MGAHALIAMQGGEHWLLTPEDGKQYGQALANALRHFPMQTTQKAIDIGTLVMVAFTIEAPRIGLSIRQAKARARGAPMPRRSATVYRMPQTSPPGGTPPDQNPDPSQPATPPIADGPPDGMGGDAPFGLN